MIHSTNDAYIRIADWCHLYMGNNTYSPAFICNIIWCGHDGKKKTDIDCNYVNLQIKEKEFGNRKKIFMTNGDVHHTNFLKAARMQLGSVFRKNKAANGMINTQMEHWLRIRIEISGQWYMFVFSDCDDLNLAVSKNLPIPSVFCMYILYGG